ncbi:MAG TPA: response regulator [Terriglobia bacterium]|nr:response regulator [Terriglobia bacterium]
MIPAVSVVDHPGPLRVLHVEHNAGDAELCRAELERSGFTVQTTRVETAQEFVDQLSSDSYDIILADYRLPAWTGLDALEVLRQRELDIPFLLGTGTMGEEMAAECIKRGAADYVLKDRLTRLPVAVRAALHERALRREQARIAREQREREAVFRMLFANNPMPMAVFDQETLGFLEVNDAAIAHYGYSRDEFLEMRVSDLRLRGDVPEVGELLRELKARGGPIVYTGETRHRHRDGTIKHVIVNWHSLRFGTRDAILAVAQDITERKRAEEALKASEALFRTLLEAAPDAILGVDQQGKIVFANAAAEALFQYPVQELLGQPVELLVPHNQREAHARARQEYYRNPHLRSRPMARALELAGLRKDGTRFPAEISLSPMSSAKGALTIAIVSDISERKAVEEEIRRLNAELERRVESRTRELEAANRELELRNREVERANQLKGRFLASMSHELRTPLNAILGFSSLLKEQMAGPLNEKQARFVEHIHHGGQHLLQLINDILDLSKIEAGRMQLHPELCVVARLLPEVLSVIQPLAIAKKIRVENILPDDVTVYADPIRFKQILYNLLSNAVKFTPEGGEVSIAAAIVDETVRLEVRDTGIGIAPDDLGHIFEEFRQVGTSTTGIREGTGLGLAITKRLVEQQGGKIWVDSKPGKGSRFFFTLPLRPPVPGGAALPSQRPSSVGRRLRPLVLIVDDDPTARELLVDYLRPEGFETLTAASGPEALTLAAQFRPDAITLNMLAASGAGWNALTELKSLPETAAIPVILVSVIDRRQLGFAMGAADYLLKPVSKQDLLAALRRHVPPSPGNKPAVLVVDDEPYDRQMMAEVLESAGYTTLTAAGGAEALRVLAGLRPDAVLLDLVMPEIDGFQVIEQIKASEDLRDLPVFVLTGKDLSELDMEALRRDTRNFFRKGLPWKEELLKQVQQAIALQDAGSAG